MTENDLRMERLENHNKFLKETLTTLTEQNNKIYIAIIGNKAMGNIGLVERINKMEEEREELKEEIITNRVYNKILIFVASVILTLVIGFMFKEKVL